jgi:hypothetical protein
MVRFRLLCGDFLLPDPAPYLENRMTVCMGYPAMTPKRESRKTPPRGGRKAMQGERLNVDSSSYQKTMWSN